MADFLTPCADPANDPEDWFLEKDGRQYLDDPSLIDDQRLAEAIVERGMLWADQGQVDRLRTELEEEAIKAAVVRRRHAKDKCHVECYFRTQCLGIALAPDGPLHGTWGGYYPEEIRKIRELRDARQRQREE